MDDWPKFLTSSPRPASRLAGTRPVEDEARPDVVVTDIVMPGLDGIARRRRSSCDVRTRAVLVSVHDDPELAERGYAAGALAYVSKHRAGHELLPAVRAAMRWRTVRVSKRRGPRD